MNHSKHESRRGTRTMHHRHFHYSEHDRGGPHRRGGGTPSGQAGRRRGVDPDAAGRATDERLRADHRTRDPQRGPLAPEPRRHLSGAAQARTSRVDHLHRGGRQAPVRADRSRPNDARLLRGGAGRRRRSAVDRGPVIGSIGRHARTRCSNSSGRLGGSAVSAPPNRSNRPRRSSPRRPSSSRRSPPSRRIADRSTGICTDDRLTAD